MGQSCSCISDAVEVPPPSSSQQPVEEDASCPDPVIYDMVRRSSQANHNGQQHLLYKKGKSPLDALMTNTTTSTSPTSSVEQRQQQELVYVRPPQLTRLKKVKTELSTHMYAIRNSGPEQRLLPKKVSAQQRQKPDFETDPYVPAQMAQKPAKKVADWVCVSQDLDIYIADTGLSHAECDWLVQTTEQACKGHYAAYTYAKQTLGCREFPVLAHACWDAVHRVTHAIWEQFPASQKLQLDDREPHIVKYDVTKKERQKLDMHTDKSEWTFLIALSDGCGLDYEGGGTFFEALDATVHVQRGHALIFPGKLRHCGQRITKGLRFLLVGFLVDKANQASAFKDMQHIVTSDGAVST